MRRESDRSCINYQLLIKYGEEAGLESKKAFVLVEPPRSLNDRCEISPPSVIVHLGRPLTF